METDQRPEPFPLIEEAEVLALLIRETDGSVLAFALYRSVTDREAAVLVLKKRLSLPVVEFTLSVQQQDPFKFIQTLPADERACVFFYDVEAALPDLAGFLNLQREAFAETPHATVFWIREYGLRELATNAPDFWAWRSGVFDFRSEQVEWSTPFMETMAGASLVFQGPGDLERKISLYEGLIEEYSQQEEPDDSFLASLLMRAAETYLFRGDARRAETYTRKALEYVRQLGQNKATVAMLIAICRLTKDDSLLNEAEEILQSILSGTPEEDTANIYLQLADISTLKDNLDQAEQRSRKAVSLSDQQDKLSAIAAESSQQLGGILMQLKRYDESEKWLGRARELFQEMGEDFRTALLSVELGEVAEAQGKFHDSTEWYSKALNFYNQLGYDIFVAGSLDHLGSVALKQQRLDQAAEYFTEALHLYNQIENNEEILRQYLNLSKVALLRNQIDETQEWLQKALDLEELQGQPSALTHAALGVLYNTENRLEEAIGYLGKGWALLEDQESDEANSLLIILATILERLGEKKFSALWREEVDDEPPIDLLKALQERINQGEAESA